MSDAALPRAETALPAHALPMLALALALALRIAMMGCPDVSWLITVCERMLAGQRLYVDIIETNPPASVYLYLPWVALAQLLRLPPELVVDVGVFLTAFAALELCRRIGLQAGLLTAWDGAALLAGVFAALLAMPLVAFGEREHFAVFAQLPVVALAAARAVGRTPTRAQWIAAGVCAGLVVVVKPPFALALVGCWLYPAWRRRDARLLFAPEYFLGAAVAFAYAGAAAALHPEYFADIFRVVGVAYLPLRMPFATLVDKYWLLAFAIALVAYASLRTWPAERERGPAVLLSLAALGYLLAAIVQGKGFLYHFLPALECGALVGVLRLTLRERAEAKAKLAPFAATALLAGLSLFAFAQARDVRALGRAVEAIEPHGSILTVTPDLGVGHPLTRDLDARWAATVGHQWMASAALQRLAHHALDPATRDTLQAIERRDHDILLADLLREKPDVVLFHRDADLDWREWAMSDPRFAAAFAPYVRADLVGDIEVWRRAP